MKFILLAATALFGASSFANTNWDFSPVQNHLPTCLIYANLRLPGNAGPDTETAEQILRRKGYRFHDDGCRDKSGPECMGVPAYAWVYLTMHETNNGSPIRPDQIRLHVFHSQYIPRDGGIEATGIYYSDTQPVSFFDRWNRATMLKMLDRLPACGALRLQEVRKCPGKAYDCPAYNGLWEDDIN